MQPRPIPALLQEAEVHLRAGRMSESDALCRQVLSADPNNALALHYLGVMAFHAGRVHESIDLLGRAAQAQPGLAILWFALAQVLSMTDRYPEAMQAADQAVLLAPNDANYRYMLGTLAGELGYLDKAIENLRRTIELKPDLTVAHNNLGLALSLCRQPAEAMECFRKAATLDPGNMMGPNNLVYYAHFEPVATGQSIRQTAEAWAKQYAEPLTQRAKPLTIERSTNQKLRVGYVSPNLGEHPVGRFLHPILANHDRGAFEVTCYSDRKPPDLMTATLRSLCDGWRETTTLNDEALAEQVRQDRIDILVDLTLHMGGTRLLAFARRPAPVQVTYLGYASTTGMSAMDWRLSDPHLDPPGNDGLYTERTMRLPRSYWCFAPPPDAGEVAPRPSRPITFACTNNLVKVSDAALAAWGQILKRVPDSRLLIHAQPGPYLSQVVEKLHCERHRVEFVPYRSFIDYYRAYNGIDILLDSFPCTGGTTSCDAMWMGVPVITLAGQLAIHRGGVSLLNNVGLHDLIAPTIDVYIDAAVTLASSRQRLSELRATLRERMQKSPLMNAVEFTRDLERAYRDMWRP